LRKLDVSELGRLSVEEFKKKEKIPLTIVLDNVRSANNVGSVFRTSDAFLVEAIHLCGITATPPNKEIQKTALGATESVTWEKYSNTTDSINILKQDGYFVCAVEQVEDSISLTDITFETDTKVAIVLGNEVNGVDQNVVDLCDACVEIPQFGTKHSLNVSVCAGITIWEFFKKITQQ